MINTTRLREALETHRGVREPFRRFRREALRLFVGKWYSDNGAAAEQPINMIELAVSTLLQHLASACPQAKVTARARKLRPAANALRLALNHLAEYEIGLEGTLQRWVTDMLFGQAIVKVGVMPVQVELMGFMHDVGQPYVDNVSEDDFVFDTGATRKDGRQFEGNHYCVPLDMLKSSGLLPAATAAGLQPSERSGTNENGDERAETMSQGGIGSRARAERYYEMIDLWEIWLPQENKLAIFQADPNLQINGEPLVVLDYEGPECGPYHELSVEDVPDQPTGLPPVALWRDLHVSINSNYRKLTNQMARQKFNNVFPGRTEEDAKRLNNAGDGETIRGEDPDKIKTVRSGGIDQSNFAFFMDSMQRFDYMHRISALGGNAAMSDTARQDEQMAGSASQRVQKMADRLRTATAGVFRSLAWHLFYEPGKQPPIMFRIPGSDIEVEDRYTPDKREGDFLDYGFDIVPYSNQRKTPADEVRELDETFQIVLQAGPAAMQAGVLANVEGYLKARADITGFKYLEDLVTFAGPQAPEEQGGEMPSAGMPANTTRNYVRRSSGGGAAQQTAGIMAMMQAGQGEAVG